MDSILSLGDGELLPQEEKLEIKNSAKNLFIGIPKEITFQENRVALVPEAVQLLVSQGHEVIVETCAGENANFLDTDFTFNDWKKISMPDMYCLNFDEKN